MSNYPGNASLATAVKDRVVSTFEQTLALHKQGRRDEVIAGCNLILQMDPLFDPARRLLEKAQNPTPLDVTGLVSGGGSDALSEARQALTARDFERVIQITTDILTNDLMNDDARMLSDEAREKIEAAPFVDQFVRKCQQHIANGNLSAARTDLEKARALDPAHPGVAQIESMIRSAESAAPAASFDASSFVVDAPAQARGSSQASDFGFTFEEEKNAPQAPADSFENFSFGEQSAPADAPFGGGFSFDTPVAGAAPAGGNFDFDASSAPKAAGNEFDFSTASIETSPDDQKKIEQYLSDGDRAFDSGDYQQAIDLWSRIFLIDVTNDAASERIERAKMKRREIEQRLEGVLAAGIQAFDRNDQATARAKFEEVLQSDPGNTQAQDYLDRINSGAGEDFTPPPPSFDDDLAAIPETSTTILPPPTGAPAPIPAPRRAPAPAAPLASGRKLPLGAIAAVVAVLVLGAAGWFAWSRFSGGNEQSQTTTQSLLARAGTLGQQGKFDEAIAVLQEIQPGDGNYDAALAMIADLQQKKSKAATIVDGRPAGEYYEQNLAAGRTAFAARDYAAAKKAFDNAARVRPLPPDVKANYDVATQQVAKLETARALFAERRYADAIASLEALRAQDPGNQSVRRMIIDAHFNAGARALQEEKLADAVRSFEAVLREDPNDELARRSRDLAQRYEGKPRDLLYRIYVKYLPLRQAAI